jgi:hypothetical protein
MDRRETIVVGGEKVTRMSCLLRVLRTDPSNELALFHIAETMRIDEMIALPDRPGKKLSVVDVLLLVISLNPARKEAWNLLAEKTPKGETVTLLSGEVVDPHIHADVAEYDEEIVDQSVTDQTSPLAPPGSPETTLSLSLSKESKTSSPSVSRRRRNTLQQTPSSASPEQHRERKGSVATAPVQRRGGEL